MPNPNLNRNARMESFMYLLYNTLKQCVRENSMIKLSQVLYAEFQKNEHNLRNVLLYIEHSMAMLWCVM